MTTTSAGDAGPGVPAPRADAGPADAGRTDAGPSDAETLALCATEEPCPLESFAQLIENSSHNIGADGVSCVLSALAQRTPGRYQHRTESVFGNGSVTAEHTLLVLEDGSALYARVPRVSVFPPGQLEMPPIEPGQRCTLREPSYFLECWAAVQANALDPSRTPGGDALAWDCSFGDGDATEPSRLYWLESCISESPLSCG